MSERKAKQERQITRLQGRECFPKPNHNTSDLPDTRSQRRDKKFRKKAHELMLNTTSFRTHRLHVAKWMAAFSAIPAAQEAAQPQTKIEASV